MPINWQELYADRTEGMRASEIREILKLTEQPNIISLAGGLPAPELFPIDEYRRAYEWVLETNGQSALQYTTTEGYRPLRELVASRLNARNMACTADDILIVHGSQQALDFMGKIFLNPGDHVVVENPTYLGAIQAFNQYQARYTVVPMDEDGMRVDMLEDILRKDAAAARRTIKLIYAVPTFQNPTGRTLSLERRQHLADISARYGVPVVEDDPYGELRYDGEDVARVKSLDRDGSVIYLGTFSKILAPGLRLGWIMASPEALVQFVHAKQPSDLQSATISQMVTYEVARNGFVDRHVETIKAFYKERRDVLLEAMAEYFPSDARFNRPAGGLFVWAELPESVDATQLLLEAIQENVAYVAGQPFHPDGSGRNTLRLNFSNVPPEMLREGVRRLGGVIKNRLAAGRGLDTPVVV